ncbi:MAG: outer membrane lipid asymmetry maintenance protein MlaD [Legionellales bacterium RIFCSPHIGHO2_12_FULL_35_11]|nr:MAG: outer membrane lipid asymmetry maintenance protein MlaD [Legionellales bacterium RIFCSPHIGHO2_12_FULL_35_11]
MNKNREQYLNLSVGIFMIFGLIALTVMVMKVSGITNLKSNKSYAVTADFADIGGLKVRAPVTIAGVKVGEVAKIELQPMQLNAKVTMLLNSDKHIPYDDTSARILTEGLLGSNYISIVPGFDSEDGNHPYLKSGDVIARTQEAIILENLIGQLLFNIKK